MADEQKQTGSSKPLDKNDEAFSGRTHNSQNPAVDQSATQNDISNVDRQEGDMKHGETGGNFDTQKGE